MATTQRSPLDLRVASGLKVVATGEDALAMTPAELRERRLLGRLKCCGRSKFMDARRFVADGQGDRPLRDWVQRMRCQDCRGWPVLEVVDPWRDALEA